MNLRSDFAGAVAGEQRNGSRTAAPGGIADRARPANGWRHFKAIALDFDGTLTEQGADLTPAVREAIARVRVAGTTVLIVSGRILDELRSVVPDITALVDALVLENGAVAVLDGTERRLAPSPDPALRTRLEQRGVPCRAGTVLLACRAEDSGAVLEEILALGLDYQLVRNRSELMVLPAGVSKGNGLLHILGRLGISRHSTIGVGDAENDLSLLAACELGVAVANAVPQLRDHADVILDQPNGKGLSAFLRSPIVTGDDRRPPRRWQLTIGLDHDHDPVSIPASQLNLLITGATRSGKSYVTGLIAEQLIEMGYSTLIIDPEGDHAPLAGSNGIVVVGGGNPLPPPEQVMAMLTHRFGSVVVDLSMIARTDASEYLRTLRRALDATRARTGLPHWIMVDEAHWLGDRQGIIGSIFDPGVTGYCLSTYRPEDLDPVAAAALDVILAVHSSDRGFDAKVAGLADVVLGLDAGMVAGDLSRLRRHGLLVMEQGRSREVTHPTPRVSTHVRHWHKYTHGELAAEARFYFCRGEGRPDGLVAGNITQFHRGIGASSGTAILHHLGRRDFSRWVADVFGDAQLAAAIAVVEQRRAASPDDVAVAQTELRSAIERAYRMKTDPAS